MLLLCDISDGGTQMVAFCLGQLLLFVEVLVVFTFEHEVDFDLGLCARGPEDDFGTFFERKEQDICDGQIGALSV